MRAEGNTLILVDRIKTGQELESIIVDLFIPRQN